MNISIVVPSCSREVRHIRDSQIISSPPDQITTGASCEFDKIQFQRMRGENTCA
ncbi:hypothetical protein J6590_017787, partial [Homalodisca vitripennis]